MSFLLFLLILISQAMASSECNYSFTVWNAYTRSSEGPFKVKKMKSSLLPEEIGEKGCSLCEEDQKEVVLSNGIKFKVCHVVAEKVRRGLEGILSTSFKIKSVTGYRPSKSKGRPDSMGRRTKFSNHAFGLAIDINQSHNGLYDNCLVWGSHCKLIMGGTYDTSSPLAITKGKGVVEILEQEGLAWGGEIAGKQKDFMHFSPDGY